MNDFEKNAEITKMTEELVHLIIKRLTNSIESEEATLLQQWLNQSPDNLRIFNEVSDIWSASAGNARDEFDSFEALKKVKVRLEKEKNQAIFVKNNTLLLTFSKVAALVLLILAVGFIAYHAGSSKFSGSSEITEIMAPMGSRTRVNLPDGTKVWLNGGSTLKFSNKFNKSDRTVSIVGEGYFDVTHNELLPFVVNTKEIRIKVLGTAFNIKAYSEDGLVETTLERGSLAIEKLTLNGKSIPQTVLEPNQRATFIRNEGKVHLSDIDKKVTQESKDDVEMKQPAVEQLLVSKKVDTQIFTSWKDNKLVFRNEPFESLAIKLERWYGVTIEIEDAEIINYHFNGVFEKETIHDVLNIIHFTLPIKYKVSHDQVYISLDKSNSKDRSNL